MATLRNPTLILAAVLLSSGPLWAAESADELAKVLLSKAGMTHGIAALPRAGDGKLALAVAQNSKFLVHAMSADRKQVDAMIQLADGAGLLAKSLYVEQGSPAALPYADNFVDLILITDLADADLAGIPAKEILRVLAPSRGRAIIGRAKSAGGPGTLSKAALETWAKGLADTNPQIEEDASGLWVTNRKPAMAGSDPWSHRYHGPGNNPVSTDTTIKGPLITQWLGLPLHEGWWGTAIVSAGGRMFTIWAPNFGAQSPGDRITLTARDLANGTTLWEKPFPAAEKNKVSYNPARCCMVATPERLYLIDGDGVLVLDAETGAEKGRIKGPQADGQIKWMALEDGILAMLVGATDNNAKTSLAINYPANPQGTLVAAYNLAAGKQLWQQETAGPVDERMIAVNGGKLYAHATGARSFCLDLKTGQQDWANSEASLLEAVDQRNEKVYTGSAIMTQRGLIACDQALVLGMVWNSKLTVLSPQTGGILSYLVNPGWGRTIRGYIREGKWFNGLAQIDLTTGKSLGAKSIPANGCGPSTAAPAVLIGGFGGCVEATSGKVLSPPEVKSPCDMGTVVSEGLIVTPPSTCRCNLPLWGYRAMTTATGLEPHAKPELDGRLISSSQEPPAALAVSPKDWPTYRSNNARTGASAVQVPLTAPAERWRWQPSQPAEFSVSLRDSGRIRTSTRTEYPPTAPISVAGKVWIGDSSGVVRCLEASSGKPLWSFPTHAKLFAPPSVAEGRLYIGSGDGWIYCLEAASGRELWRFHAAPSDRRMMWYGHLISTWPVVPGVLVHDGTAYAAAGYQTINGIYVYALDAATGQVRWENHEAGQVLLRFASSGTIGTMTVAQGRLWLASGSIQLVSFDLKTGDIAPKVNAPPPKSVQRNMLRGSEIAAFTERFILYGGRRLAAGYDERGNPGQGTGFGFLNLKDDQGRQDGGVLTLPNSTLPPSWDGELMVVARTMNSGLEGWNTPKLTSFLDKAIAKNSDKWIDPPEFVYSGRPATAPAPTLVWTGPKCEASATALADNAVLVAYVETAAGLSKGLLSGLDRNTGKTLWTANLPSEPVFNGLAIDQAGQVLVALRDGSLVCYGPQK